MKEETIIRCASLLKELDLSAIEITEKGSTVRLERNGMLSPSLSSGYEMPKTVEKRKEEDKKAIIEDTDSYTVNSPIVGVFYASNAENAEPFVKVGSKVKKGDTLCLIEAMKLMNEIDAEEDGKVLEILAKNGQVVEYGTPLFRMGRA